MIFYIEKKGHRIAINDQDPSRYQELMGLDWNKWNKLDPEIVLDSPGWQLELRQDNSGFVSTISKFGDVPKTAAEVAQDDRYQWNQMGLSIKQTLEKVQTFLSNCTERITERAEGFKDSWPWHEVFVDGWQLDAARCFSRIAAKDLNIKTPDAKFFRKAEADEKVIFRTTENAFGANTKDGVIWIREDRGGSGFIDTVGHEVYHQVSMDEASAKSYGEQFAARFGSIPSWAELYVFPFVWEEEFCFYETRKEASHGSWLINLKNGSLYEKGWGGWQERRQIKL